MTLAVALDLGSSQIKAGVLEDNGQLRLLGHLPSPPLHGGDRRRVSEPDAYLARSTRLLARAELPKGTPLGISTQRSSFLLWRRDGTLLTPLISWQDRRAEPWCRQRRAHAAEMLARTGLVFSPHYAGPKLSFLLEREPEIMRLARQGKVLFGTLETYLIWRWTGGNAHITALSVAARTLMVDLQTGDWCPELLRFFGVPRDILPDIVTRPPGLDNATGYPLTAVMGDQASGAVPLFAAFPAAGYVNAGTGTFLMRYHTEQAPPGLLTAFLGDTTLSRRTTFWEGAIHAGSRLFHQFESLIVWDDSRPLDTCLAMPEHGWGAPYWRADLGPRLSDDVLSLGEPDRHRILMEAYLFRIREVLETLFDSVLPEAVLLSGGLAARSDFTAALAGFLPSPLFTICERELGLWGIAWMAASCPFPAKLRVERVPTCARVAYLEHKYGLWRAWLAQQISGE